MAVILVEAGALYKINQVSAAQWTREWINTTTTITHRHSTARTHKVQLLKMLVRLARPDLTDTMFKLPAIIMPPKIVVKATKRKVLLFQKCQLPRIQNQWTLLKLIALITTNTSIAHTGILKKIWTFMWRKIPRISLMSIREVVAKPSQLISISQMVIMVHFQSMPTPIWKD